MNRRNILLIALLSAAFILGVMAEFDTVGHAWLTGILYFPAIFATVALTGNLHEAGAAAGTTSFVAYTIFYLLLVVVLYAVLLEFVLLRTSLNRVGRLETLATLDGPTSVESVRHYGLALADLERRRRGHWVLKPAADLRLDQPPEALASYALTHGENIRHARRLLGRMESVLSGKFGAESANREIERMRAFARANARG